MRKSELNLRDKSSFAYEVGPTDKGHKLMICGKEYHAWSYDTYIYGALRIAGFWDPKYRTYERIMHLRYWLRENVSHGHDMVTNIRSLTGAKRLVDKIIESEYRDPIWEKEKAFQLSENKKIFEAV